jgi:hypothetical protein
MTKREGKIALVTWPLRNALRCCRRGGIPRFAGCSMDHVEASAGIKSYSKLTGGKGIMRAALDKRQFGPWALVTAPRPG